MFAEQFDELRQPAFFIRAEVVVDDPAEVVLAEVVIVFLPLADDGIQLAQARGFSLAQLPAQCGADVPAAQRPHGIDKRQLRQLEPRRAEIPNLVRMRLADEVERRVADEQHGGVKGAS